MAFYKILGFVLLALGVIGIFLPLLPTTPFLIGAAACFAKSSEKWHAWLLSNRVFGPTIIKWQERKCISRSTKFAAIGSMLVLGGFSVGFIVEHDGLRVAGVVLLSIGSFTVYRLKTCTDGCEKAGT